MLIGGTAVDPGTVPGRDTALARFEERIIASLYRRTMLGLSP